MNIIKTSSITELRGKLSETIASLEKEEAVMVVRHSKPAAYLVSTDLFETFIEVVEDLEDIRDMTAAIRDFHQGEAVEAEEVFERLGL